MPMTIKEMQQEIIANRVRRGWRSATELDSTTLGLAEEVGEFEKARKQMTDVRDIMLKNEVIDALGDIMVYCLGGLEIVGADAQTVLEEIIERNKTRTHKGVH